MKILSLIRKPEDKKQSIVSEIEALGKEITNAHEIINSTIEQKLAILKKYL